MDSKLFLLKPLHRCHFPTKLSLPIKESPSEQMSPDLRPWGHRALAQGVSGGFLPECTLVYILNGNLKTMIQITLKTGLVWKQSLSHTITMACLRVCLVVFWVFLFYVKISNDQLTLTVLFHLSIWSKPIRHTFLNYSAIPLRFIYLQG